MNDENRPRPVRSLPAKTEVTQNFAPKSNPWPGALLVSIPILALFVPLCVLLTRLALG